MRSRKQAVLKVEVIYAAIPEYEERLRKVMQLLLRPSIAQEANTEENARKAKSG